MRYAHFQREVFQGTAGIAAAPVTNNLNFSPKQNESVVMTSLRH